MESRKVLALIIAAALLAIIAYMIYGILSELGYHFDFRLEKASISIDVSALLSLIRNIIILLAIIVVVAVSYALFKRSRVGATLFLSASGLILFIVLELEVLSIFGGMVVGAQVFAILLITYAIALWKWL